MAYCYRCGVRIAPGARRSPRRKVPTSEWVRKGYGKGRVNATQTHYGMRIVCPNCARRIDLENRGASLIEDIKFALALITLFALLAYLAWFRN